MARYIVDPWALHEAEAIAGATTEVEPSQDWMVHVGLAPNTAAPSASQAPLVGHPGVDLFAPTPTSVGDQERRTYEVPVGGLRATADGQGMARA